MDGSNRVTFQSTDIGLPSSLIIDDSLEVVWADTQQNRIESATFDGLSRGVAYSSLPARDPLSFAIHLDTLYFVGFFEGVYAVRTDSNLRLLNPVGCTVSDSIQVISSARQPLGTAGSALMDVHACKATATKSSALLKWSKLPVLLMATFLLHIQLVIPVPITMVAVLPLRCACLAVKEILALQVSMILLHGPSLREYNYVLDINFNPAVETTLSPPPPLG